MDTSTTNKEKNFVDSHYSTRKDRAAIEASHRPEDTLIGEAML